MKIAIIMPAYNAQETIDRAVRSVISQSYCNWELLIIDDASTDKTRDVVSSFSDKRIRLIENKKNSGPGYCRDVGLQATDSEFIAFLDSDDFWEQTFLEVYIGELQKSNVDIVYGAYFMLSSDGRRVFQPRTLSLPQLYIQSPLSCLAILMKKEITIDCKFDGSSREDLNFWIQVLGKHTVNFSVIRVPLATYWLNKKGRSSNKIKVGAQTLLMIMHSQHLSAFQKVFAGIAYVVNGFLKYKFSD